MIGKAAAVEVHLIRLVLKHWPLAAALAVFCGITGWLVASGLARTQGHLAYCLDDAYIHMAVAKHVAQELAESSADALVDLELEEEARMAQLHRLLQGDDLQLVDFSRRQVVEEGVQERGLARAGRTGDVHQAVRLAEELLQVPAVGGEEVELGERAHAGGLVEDADDDRLAVDGGDAGEAQVVASPAVFDASFAVIVSGACTTGKCPFT